MNYTKLNFRVGPYFSYFGRMGGGGGEEGGVKLLEACVSMNGK